MLRKLVLIHAAFVGLSTGILYLETVSPDLIWSMCLALLALNAAVLVVTSKKWYVKLLALPVWLLFYPQTFYLLTVLTDPMLSGLALGDLPGSLTFVLYVGSVLLGVFSGVLSLAYVFEGLRLTQPYVRLVVLTVLSVFSSGMIFLRLSAGLSGWVFLRQLPVLLSSLPGLLNKQTLPLLLGLTGLQVLALLFMEKE